MMKAMLCYHAAYYLPQGENRMVVAEVLDFPGVCSQGFDLADARVMIASALEEMAQVYLEEGKALPRPTTESAASDADLVELIPLAIEAGVHRS
jgi:predicted RNase H-like HicB family nuclease